MKLIKPSEISAKILTLLKERNERIILGSTNLLRSVNQLIRSILHGIAFLFPGNRRGYVMPGKTWCKSSGKNLEQEFREKPEARCREKPGARVQGKTRNRCQIDSC
jgi:hypothetical protein